MHLTTGERYRRVRRKLRIVLGEGWFVRRDKQPSLYLYEQEPRRPALARDHCAASLDDYREGRIRTHEHTLHLTRITFRALPRHHGHQCRTGAARRT